MKKCIFSSLLVAVLLCVLVLPADAALTRVEMNGQRVMDSGQSRVIDGIFCVPMEEFAVVLGATRTFWDAETKTLTVQTKAFTATARAGDEWIEVNDACIYVPGGVLENRDGVLVPLETVCRLFGAGMRFESPQHAVLLPGESIPTWQTSYSSDDLYWLTRIVYAEAGAESFACQLAVAEVVLNRVASDMFPDDVHSVIFDSANGVQFTPTENGSIKNDGSRESEAAAKAALSGSTYLPDNVLFFVSSQIGPNWVSMERTFVLQIGVTDFYA